MLLGAQFSRRWDALCAFSCEKTGGAVQSGLVAHRRHRDRGDEVAEVVVGLVGVGGAAAVDTGVEHHDRPVELEQLVGRGGLDTGSGRCPDHVDAPDDVVLALVGDDRLAQPAGLGEQLVEQLSGRPGGDELGGRRRRTGRIDGDLGIDLGGAAGECRDRQDHERGDSRPSMPATQTLTRMRALAKAPTPTWWPPISTVNVPSGRHRRDRAVGARHQRRLLEVLEQPGRELELLGDAADGERVADIERRQRRRRRLDVVGARDRVAVRARRRVAEQTVECRLDGASSSRAPTCRPRDGPRPTTAAGRR